jgi:[protein-PII] uridylyltransferase
VLRASVLGRPDLIGSALRRALTETTDRWLADLLDEALAGEPADGLALVAVGAYGRREPAPGSDLDLVLLHAGDRDRTDLAELAERLWYPVWDAGVGLDHSVRSVGEAVAVARDDLKAGLGLLDARHVAGDPRTTRDLVATWRAAWRDGASRRLAELHDAAAARAETSGEIAYLLEPDLKNGRGGLRDIAVLDAVAVAQVGNPPRDRVRAARELLLDVRGELHRRLGRGLDVLLLQEQDGVAEALSEIRPQLAGGRSAGTGALGAPSEEDPADRLLRAVAGAARLVTHDVDEAWRRVEAWRSSQRRRWRRGRVDRRPLAPGVVVQGGEVVLARGADPAADPVLVLRLAAAAAEAGLPIAPATLGRLASESAVLPEPWTPDALDAFLALLGSGPGLVPVWEALDHAGLVDRLLPEWERVRSKPQRNAYHRFTVDRHLVEAAVCAAELTRTTDRPDLLLLAALLHDLGKGWPGDHSEVGARVVGEVAPRLGLPPDDVRVLVALIRHHLLLPDTATRRDPDDPATSRLVAEACGDRTVLGLLVPLARADGLATGPAAWSDWKAGLVEGLAARVAAVLAGRPAPPPPGPTPLQERLAVRGEVAVGVEGDVDAVGKGRGSATVTMAAPDQPGLLAAAAGVLALHRLDVRAAVVDVLPGPRGPVGVPVFAVAPRPGAGVDPGRLRDDLRRALDGSLDVTARLAEREAAYTARPGRPRPAPPVVLLIDGEASGATVVQVRAPDGLGVLHRACRALTGCGLDVRSARVQTLGAEVVDSFYAVGPDGGELVEGALRERVRRSLLEALTPGPERTPSG